MSLLRHRSNKKSKVSADRSVGGRDCKVKEISALRVCLVLLSFINELINNISYQIAVDPV